MEISAGRAIWPYDSRFIMMKKTNSVDWHLSWYRVVFDKIIDVEDIKDIKLRILRILSILSILSILI